VFSFADNSRGNLIGGAVWLIVGLFGMGALVIQYSKGLISFSPHDTDVVSVVISLFYFAAAVCVGVLLFFRKLIGVVLMLVLSSIWLIYGWFFLWSFWSLVSCGFQFLFILLLAIPLSSLVFGLRKIFSSCPTD